MVEMGDQGRDRVMELRIRYIDIRVDTIDVSYVFTRMPHARTQHMQIGYDGLKNISEVAHRHGYRIRAMLVKTSYARLNSHTRSETSPTTRSSSTCIQRSYKIRYNSDSGSYIWFHCYFFPIPFAVLFSFLFCSSVEILTSSIPPPSHTL